MKLALSDEAKKQYQHLSKSDQEKILKKFVFLQKNPQAGKKLMGELKGVYSLRAWPYRIIYEINQQKSLIEVHKIAHRQGVYK